MSSSRPSAEFEPHPSRRSYVVSPLGPWWRVVSEEGEVARYRTRAAALDGAWALARAMRRLGLESGVAFVDDPGPERRAA